MQKDSETVEGPGLFWELKEFGAIELGLCEVTVTAWRQVRLVGAGSSVLELAGSEMGCVPTGTAPL